MIKQTEIWERLIGQEVVIDIESHYVILGKLVGQLNGHLELEHADVHDMRDSESGTRELYIMKSCQHGIRANRERVFVPVSKMVAISALEDVMVF